MFSARVEECPDPPMTRSERRGGGQESRRGGGGPVEDLPNRLYDMVVVFWLCAVEGGFWSCSVTCQGSQPGRILGHNQVRSPQWS